MMGHTVSHESMEERISVVMVSNLKLKSTNRIHRRTGCKMLQEVVGVAQYPSDYIVT